MGGHPDGSSMEGAVPELPEVETIVRDLRRQGVPGRRIGDMELHWPGVVGGEEESRRFRRLIPGRRIERIRRRAKYLIFDLQGGLHLVAHLRMTGRIHLGSGCVSRAGTRLTLRLDDGRSLVFVDPRKFGRWLLVDDPERVLARLGPEPLGAGFTTRWLAEALRRHHRQIKPLLLDQHFVAGLGNIYADEALWLAGIHPCRCSSALRGAEIGALHRAIRAVLRQGIRNRGTSLGEGRPNFQGPDGRRGGNRGHLKVFRKTGEPCPRCGTGIERLVVGQRGTHVCPVCQISPSSLPCASR